MKCNTHHIEYGGPFCPQCVRDMNLGQQGGISVDEIRRIVREELQAAGVTPRRQVFFSSGVGHDFGDDKEYKWKQACRCDRCAARPLEQR